MMDRNDITGGRPVTSTVKVSIYKSNKFTPFVGVKGRVCFRPEDRSLEFVKDIQCAKHGSNVQIPSMNLSHEPDADGNPGVIYVFAEHVIGGELRHLATMHFERDESDPMKYHACFYNDMGTDDKGQLSIN